MAAVAEMAARAAKASGTSELENEKKKGDYNEKSQS